MVNKRKNRTKKEILEISIIVSVISLISASLFIFWITQGQEGYHCITAHDWYHWSAEPKEPCSQKEYRTQLFGVLAVIFFLWEIFLAIIGLTTYGFRTLFDRKFTITNNLQSFFITLGIFAGIILLLAGF